MTIITLDLSGGVPPSPEHTLELAEALPEVVRALNHQMMNHEALRDPADAGRLLHELATAVQRLPQLLGQVGRWCIAEDAAGRIGVPSGEWAGRPATAVEALRVQLAAASASAKRLLADLEYAALVSACLTAAGGEEGDDDAAV